MKKMLVLATSTLLFGFALSCNQGGYSGETEALAIAAVPTELNALVYVAEEQGYLEDNGLEVTFKEYDSGATSAAGMLNGEADIAFAAEFPIVRQVFNNEEIINFGTIARYENTYIIWRIDSGIKDIQDLKGKKIGVTLTTISEFYLGRTLELNGLNIERVTFVDTKAADAEKALVSGEVDAVVTWEPWVGNILQSMGDEVTSGPVQSGQKAYWNLVATGDWVDSNPGTIERFVKSLTEAEVYVSSHQDAAKAVVGEWTGIDDAFLDDVWARYEFSLSLEQPLILAMEDEARWMIKNNLTPENQVPNFLDYIYADGLKSVKPGAVKIAGR